MATELAIIGDTHVPTRAEGLPAWVRERVEAADHTIHTGDFETAEMLERVEEMSGGDLTAVRGNVDRGGVDLPNVATYETEGVQFVVTHGTGDRVGYGARVVAAVNEHGRDGAVGVAGHTHEYTDEVTDGTRILNPGSATGADPASETTMMTVTVDDGDVDVTLHRGE
ncbi:metallophosphoesterase family protein [Haloplanus sp. GCM10025708]|uniref:metallophosphoesterase family protein n=1 Tax=Haloferacaceae TaxID=1644056 RepID=UPI003621C382